MEMTTVRVGIDSAPPFAYAHDGAWTGVSVDLFEAVAAINGWRVDYVTTPVARRLDALEMGAIDVYVPATTITADREAHFDFSHGYYRDYLGVASVESPTWGATFLAEAYGPLAAFGGAILFVGVLYAVIERRSPWAGVYWSLTTLATVGYGDEAPKTRLGRLLAMIWMLTSLCSVGWFVGALLHTSAARTLTVADIPRGACVIENTTAEQAVRAPFACFDASAMLAAARAGQCVAVYDESTLRADASDLFTLRVEDAPQDYAFIFPEGSELVEPANRALLRVLSSPRWRGILAAHLAAP